MKNEIENDEALIEKAYLFAKAAHESVIREDGGLGQLRKYSGLPYITHPQAVAAYVKKYVKSYTVWDIMAALLHDVVEDTPVTIEEIYEAFGVEVGDRVAGLTDVSKPEDGNRAFRKEKDCLHTLEQPVYVRNVKLADIYHNHFSMLAEAPSGFAHKWMKEKGRMIFDPIFDDCDPTLLAVVRGAFTIYLEGKKNDKAS